MPVLAAPKGRQTISTPPCRGRATRPSMLRATANPDKARLLSPKVETGAASDFRIPAFLVTKIVG